MVPAKGTMAPRKPKRVRKPRQRPLYTFSLSPEAHEMLEAIAGTWGASLSATVERLIRVERRREARR
ncbi:MAG: hypothetical protein ACREI8_15875 [Myxococcota bacterium]